MMTIFAAVNNPLTGGLSSLGGVEFFGNLVSVVISIIMAIGAIIFVFMLVTGGVDWIRSGSDKGALESARTKLLNAVTGLILIFATWAIISLIEGVFRINILRFDVPTVANPGGTNSVIVCTGSCSSQYPGQCPAGENCTCRQNLDTGLVFCSF